MDKETVRDRSVLRVNVPSVPGNNPDCESMEKAASALAEAGKPYRKKVWESYGLELRAVGRHLELARPGNAAEWQFLRRLERHLTRPATEPAATEALRMVRQRDGVNLALDRLPQRLAPGCRMRLGPAWASSIPGGSRILYPEADETSWRQTVRQMMDRDDRPLTSAIILLGITVLAHPVTDGNGRLSRALFWLTLMHHDIVPCPVAPLGLEQDLQSIAMIGAMRELSRSGDWEPFCESVAQLVLRAVCLV